MDYAEFKKRVSDEYDYKPPTIEPSRLNFENPYKEREIIQDLPIKSKIAGAIGGTIVAPLGAGAGALFGVPLGLSDGALTVGNLGAVAGYKIAGETGHLIGGTLGGIIGAPIGVVFDVVKNIGYGAKMGAIQGYNSFGKAFSGGKSKRKINRKYKGKSKRKINRKYKGKSKCKSNKK